jgi:starvation-inducible DNA-binding protein
MAPMNPFLQLIGVKPQVLPDWHLSTKAAEEYGMEPKVNIGIPETNREEIAKGLSRFLADTYSLYLKSHSFHWNVTGPMFNTLHAMFMEQYTELWTAVDEVAERIRALDEYAPGTYSDFAKLTSIKEANGVPNAKEMIAQLLEGHETAARTARSVMPAAEKGGDEGTLDLLTGRLKIHEKTAWMLRSLLRD